MRDAFISLLTVLAVLTLVKSSEIGKDGFNFYKDHLRARVDDTVAADGISSGERILYFYRRPLRVYPDLLAAVEQEYKKRTANVFKNHMLSKDVGLGPGNPDSRNNDPEKRLSKETISFILGKQPRYIYDAPVEEHLQSQSK